LCEGALKTDTPSASDHAYIVFAGMSLKTKRPSPGKPHGPFGELLLARNLFEYGVGSDDLFHLRAEHLDAGHG